MSYDNKNKRRRANGNVELTKGYKRKMFLQKILSLGIFIICLMLAFCLIFALHKGTIRTENGLVYTINVEPELNNEVLIMNDKKDDHINKILRIFIVQDSVKGEIFAGPYGAVFYENGKYSFADSVDPNLYIKLDKTLTKKYLENQFIIKLDNGEYTIVNAEDVLKIDK